MGKNYNVIFDQVLHIVKETGHISNALDSIHQHWGQFYANITKEQKILLKKTSVVANILVRGHSLSRIYTGKVFNRWTIGKFLYKKEGRYGGMYFECKCVCGKICERDLDSIISERSKSCGCYCGDIARLNFTKYQKDIKNTVEYKAWANMKTRCYNSKRKQYSDYGGRGIVVCKRWKNSFDNFLKDMGLKPSLLHSLDRYPNTNGNYEPGNCRWATAKQQANNKTTSILIKHNSLIKSLKEWSDYLGIGYSCLIQRNNRGLKGNELFFIGKYKSGKNANL